MAKGSGKKEVNDRLGKVGGQAVIDGVMMKAGDHLAISVRRANGEVVSKLKPFVSVRKKVKILDIPIIRGIVNFIEMMVMSMDTMNDSIEMLDIEEELQNGTDAKEAESSAESDSNQPAEAETKTEERKLTGSVFGDILSEAKAYAKKDSSADSDPSKPKETLMEETMREAKAFLAKERKEQRKQKESKEKKGASAITVTTVIATVLGLALAFGLFFWLPVQIGNIVRDALAVKDAAGEIITDTLGFWRSPLEAVIKLTIFLGYILLVSLMSEIRRTFQYHGAEHMSVFCYEAGDELTVDNVRKYSRFHPRCGTSFLIVMVVLGVIISLVIPLEFGPVLRTLLKLATFPIVIGLGYEFIRFAGMHDNILVRIISAPGLWVQRLTTKKPDDGMLEVAVKSLKMAIEADEASKADKQEASVENAVKN
ncbi:hypothetical protein FACS1894105_12720 [Clostridia bacterium]|nr:hypothetical protein FACS1894105_12720 [Clostridia bacterium]